MLRKPCKKINPLHAYLMQNESSDELAEAVARAVLAKYAELPKNGKPSPTEWTILSGLAASRAAGGGEEVAVVALATGSKCLGAGKLRPDGRALHDSHAEVLARRSFVHFLQTQLLLLSELGEASAANDDCILQWAPGASTRHTRARSPPVYGLSPNRPTASQRVSGVLLADCTRAVAFGAWFRDKMRKTASSSGGDACCVHSASHATKTATTQGN